MYRILILLLILPAVVGAQSWTELDALVRKNMANDSLFWVKHYEGRLDDTYGSRIVLGASQNRISGYLHYYKSGLSLRLEGRMTGPVLRIKELNSGDKPTGYITATLRDGIIDGEWINHNNSLGSTVFMKELPPEEKKYQFCGEDKWMRRFSGTSKGNAVELVIVKLQADILLANIWDSGEGKAYDLKGTLDKTGFYALESELDADRTKHWLEGEFKDTEKTKASWTSSEGAIHLIEMELRESLTLGCIEQAKYLSSYDIVFPQTTCADCNSKFSSIVQHWEKRCIEGISNKRLTEIPANRNVLRASMWPEISCWTDRLLSGFLNYTDSWSAPSQGQAFNIDLETGEFIRLEDIFRKGFDYKAWLDEYMRKESPRNPQFANDPKFREWLYAKGYPLFTIRRDGLKMSTLFHPIYGQQHLLVSWDKLTGELKGDSPVKDFLPPKVKN